MSGAKPARESEPKYIVGHHFGHEIDTGNGWKVICDCGWEAWDRPTWEAARTAHRRHRKKMRVPW